MDDFAVLIRSSETGDDAPEPASRYTVEKPYISAV